MEDSNIVACPSCGALGKVGEPCEFCGTTIVVRDDAATYEERIISKRTISSMAFAQKVSVFKNVGEFIFNCSVVRMGSLCGVINLDGDFIFPLEYGDIVLYPEGYAYLRKDSEKFFFDLAKWKRLDLELFDRGAPDGLSRDVVRDNYLITLYWEWYSHKHDVHCHVNRVYFFDINDQVVLWSDYDKQCKTGFISRYPASYIDIRTQKKYSLPCKEYYYPFLGGMRDVLFIDKQGDLVVTLDYHRDFFSVVNTGVEDIQAEIDRACYEVLSKYKASMQPEKKGVGCVIAFLPFLALGTGAIFGVLELIKHVFC